MRFKDICTLSPSYVGDMLDKEVSFVPMESLRNGEIDLKEIPFGEAKGKYTYFGNGDLLVAKVTPCFENGNIAIAEKLKEGVGFGSSEIFVLRMKESAYNRYMFYIVQSSKFQGEACSTMCGVGGLKRISPLFMKTYELDLPPLPVQHRIASYLDAKTGEIDGRVALLEQKLDAYARLMRSVINRAVTRGLNPNVPLKNSQVDWIGQIPQHWVSYRLKDIGSLYSGLSGKSGDDFRCDDDSKTKPFIQFTNVLNNTTIDPCLFGRVVMEENEQQNRVEINDLIFLMSSEDYESIAKPAVVRDDLGEMYLNSFCRGMHIDQSIAYSPFVNYQLNSDFCRDSIRYEARGFTRINIKIDRIACQQITLPPLPEQQAIADYLDGKCAEIDAAVANTEKQIEALKRLKRSLINEVVTGKRVV